MTEQKNTTPPESGDETPQHKAGVFAQENPAAETSAPKKKAVLHIPSAIVSRKNEGVIMTVLGVLVGGVLIAIIALAMSVVHDEQSDVKTAVPAATPSVEDVAQNTNDDNAIAISSGEGIALDENGEPIDVAADAHSDEAMLDGSVMNGGNTTTQPAGNTASKSAGWNMVYFNTENFDIDDEDSDVGEVTMKEDVCKKLYKQNPHMFTQCLKSSKLTKASSPSLGAEKCAQGCALGQTCLIWDKKEDSDGSLRVHTAMYRCE